MSASFTGPMAFPEVDDLDPEGNPLPDSRPLCPGFFGIHNLQLT